jgi:PAS domain S-box-containing protein
MEVVAFSIFYGVVATSGSRNFAQSVLQLLAGREVHIRWILFVFLLCLSAATGVLIHRLFVLAEMLKQDHDVMPGQLSMLRAVVANLPDLIYVKDMNSRFLLANQATANAMGAGSGSALLGKSDSDFYPEELASGFFMDERKIMLSGQPLVNREENIPEPNGQIRTIMTTKVPLRDSAGKVIGIIGIGSNITQLKAVEAALMEAREELEFKAAHDSLTSLLNRGAILELLVRELARCARVNGSTAVLLGDLDHFKKINDQHGHPIGDEVLRAVACRLVGTVRSSCERPSPLRRFRLRTAQCASPSASACLPPRTGASPRPMTFCARWMPRCMRPKPPAATGAPWPRPRSMSELIRIDLYE